MTGYTVHTGSSEKFSSGWDRIFGRTKRSKTSSRKDPASTAAQPKRTKSPKTA